jgi:hypothetical protein
MKKVLLLAVCAICLGVLAIALPSVIVHGQGSIPAYTDYVYATYTTNSLLKPTGIYIKSTSPNYLFISDTGHNQVDVFNGSTLSVLAGNGTAGYVDSALASSEFDAPTAITGIGFYERSGGFGSIPTIGMDLIVVDSLNNAMRHVCSFKMGYLSPGPSCGPEGVTTTSGGSAGFANGTGANAAFNLPGATGTSASLGTQLVADLGNNAVRTIDPTGVTVGTAISSVPGFVNGPLGTAQFRGVSSLTAVTGSNPLTLLSDTGNFVIRSINSNNSVSTFAGNGIQGYADGPATSAEFAMPLGITYNPVDGYTYVADALNNCIRRIDSSGTVTTYAGQKGKPGLVDGLNLQAEFSNPSSIAIANGFMYIADTTNNAIRRIDMTNLQVSTYIH